MPGAGSNPAGAEFEKRTNAFEKAKAGVAGDNTDTDIILYD
jgi:hypothetical protein